MLQLATYWLLRGHQLPEVVGFGLICVAYNELKDIDLHVIVPTQQAKIVDIINDFHSQKFEKAFLKTFQARFKKGTYELRKLLANCQENT